MTLRVVWGAGRCHARVVGVGKKGFVVAVLWLIDSVVCASLPSDYAWPCDWICAVWYGCRIGGETYLLKE